MLKHIWWMWWLSFKRNLKYKLVHSFIILYIFYSLHAPHNFFSHVRQRRYYHMYAIHSNKIVSLVSHCFLFWQHWLASVKFSEPNFFRLCPRNPNCPFPSLTMVVVIILFFFNTSLFVFYLLRPCYSQHLLLELHVYRV